MADPLSIASSAFAVVSLAVQVTQSLVKFYQSYKDRNQNIKRTFERLTTLLGTFEFLGKILATRRFRLGEEEIVQNIAQALNESEELILELQEELEKFQRHSGQDIWQSVKTTGRRFTYPFRESTLKKLDEDIQAVRDSVTLAVDALQLRGQQDILGSVDDIHKALDLIRAAGLAADIRSWLKAPDVSVNHNAACTARYPGTGNWFIHGPDFKHWLYAENSFLWVNGFAGCGKSVLCSTSVQRTLQHKQSIGNAAVCFFYFTFNDESKQNTFGMLSALTQQLAVQVPEGELELKKVREVYPTGVPTVHILLASIKRLILKVDQVYVLLDGLDEVERGRARDHLLAAINTIRGWALPSLHLLATSRNELDIRDMLGGVEEQEIAMRGDFIDQDIQNFINGHLSTDARLMKWQRQHEKIRKTLSEKANGVFRWVECQFEAIKRCPRSPKRLEQCLRSLPDTLDETYERMLQGISSNSRRDAQRILTMLCYAARPLRLDELVDAIAVETDDPSGLNQDLRLADSESLQEICPGLLVFEHDGTSEIEGQPPRYSKSDDTKGRVDAGKTDSEDDGMHSGPFLDSNILVRIAHFSVQEYLESTRIKQGKASRFALIPSSGHAEILHICLLYLLESPLTEHISTEQQEEIVCKQLPLTKYAAGYWHFHYHRIDAEPTATFRSLISRMFSEENAFYDNCVSFYKLEKSSYVAKGKNKSIDAEKRNYPPRLYLAAYRKMTWLVQNLIRNGSRSRFDRDSGLALCAATTRGYADIVQILVDAKANMSYTIDEGNPVQLAAREGFEEIVDILIRGGADVNAVTKKYGSALFAAAGAKSLKVIDLLQRAGARVPKDFRGRCGGDLHEAVLDGDEERVRLFFTLGADLNYFENAPPLVTAVHSGNINMTKLLIELGADVNNKGNWLGAPLQVAVQENHLAICRILLHHNADPNVSSRAECRPLQRAVGNGNATIVQMLLDAGAQTAFKLRWYDMTNVVDMARFLNRSTCFMTLLKVDHSPDSDEYTKRVKEYQDLQDTLKQQRDLALTAAIGDGKKSTTVPTLLLNGNPVNFDYNLYEPRVITKHHATEADHT